MAHYGLLAQWLLLFYTQRNAGDAARVTSGWRVTSAGLPGDASALARRLEMPLRHRTPARHPRALNMFILVCFFSFFNLHLGFGAPQTHPANPTLLQGHVETTTAREGLGLAWDQAPP